MVKIKFICPNCRKVLQCDEEYRGCRIKCRHCKNVLLLPEQPQPLQRPGPKLRKLKFIRAKRGLICGAAAALAVIALAATEAFPTLIHWSDRRPIGVLMLASHYHCSAVNPRGWFNDRTLDITSTNGEAVFREALFKYEDRSIAVLKRVGAQGVIVWDLDGEQFPQKTSYIGDPRLVEKLAPEMAPVVDEFFKRLRDAGFRVGVTVRPQQLVFDDYGLPRQKAVLNIKRTLLEKIDYARSRWGATLFYIDSNYSFFRPDEGLQLRSLAAERPGILLIPEHHDFLYEGFSAPYVSLRRKPSASESSLAKMILPHSFQVLDVADEPNNVLGLADASARGDILLFRAWYWNTDCELIEQAKHFGQMTQTAN